MKKIYFLIMLFALIGISSVIAQDDLLARDWLDKTENSLRSTNADKISMIIPALLLIMTLICWSIDFGVTGVTLTSMLSMVVLYWTGLVYMNPVSLTAFVIMGLILVYKMRQ